MRKTSSSPKQEVIDILLLLTITEGIFCIRWRDALAVESVQTLDTQIE